MRCGINLFLLMVRINRLHTFTLTYFNSIYILTDTCIFYLDNSLVSSLEEKSVIVRWMMAPIIPYLYLQEEEGPPS
jgi:hypothetical protein